MKLSTAVHKTSKTEGGDGMTRDFFPFVEETGESDAATAEGDEVEPKYPARIAVYDDPSVTPRVVVIEPTNVRDFLASITETVTRLSHEQGGSVPFTIIREIVENYIHASFIEPTITILDGGRTIRFCDQGPGIRDKDRALEFGTTSATEPMKRYIRGVGSGLPIAQQYMVDKGGSLSIQDNISGGTIVTISTLASDEVRTSPEDARREAGQVGGNDGREAGAWTQQQAPQAAPTGWSGPWTQGSWPWQAQQPQAQQPPAWVQPQAMPAVFNTAPMPPQTPTQPSVATPAPSPAASRGETPGLNLTVRGHRIVSYLVEHGEAGGKELMAAYGGSAPTWSRELQQLDALGITHKVGQKRQLTDMARQWLSAGGAAS